MLTILHVIPDVDDPYAIVAKIMDAIPPRSYLAISHAGSDLFSQETAENFKGVLDRMIQQ